MALSNLQVFSDFVYTVYTETLQQQVYFFNQASDNAIRLVAGDNVGDFNSEVMFAEIAANNGITRELVAEYAPELLPTLFAGAKA